MNPRSAALLWDVACALDAAAEFTTGKTYDDYLANRMMRSAVERQMEIAGEALAALRRTDAATAALIPELGEVVAFRNFLSHEYRDVDDGVVWRAATDYGVALRRLIVSLLPSPE